MTMHMVLNTDKGISIEQEVERITKMNKALLYLPYLKHKEGSPMAMTGTHVKYLDI